MKKQKGFTLVEIIVVIALLSIIGGIFILNMTGVLNKSKASENENNITTIISAAKAYVTSNPEKVERLYKGYSYINIKVGELRDEGYLQEDIKDTKTGEVIPDGKVVKVSYNIETDELNFEFGEDDEDELERYALVSEPLSLLHDDNAIESTWCNNEANKMTGYNSQLGTSRLYFVDKYDNYYDNELNKKINIVSTYCNVNLKQVGNYRIDYEYTYQDEKNETIKGKSTRNIYVVPDRFNLTFDANGGDANTVPSSTEVTWSQEYTFPGTIPTRRGYTFLGWAYRSDVQHQIFKAKQTLIFMPTVPSRNVILYAVWKINYYNITINVDGGSSSPTSKVIEYLGTGVFTLTEAENHWFEKSTVTCTSELEPSIVATINKTAKTLNVSNIYGNATCNVKLPLAYTCPDGGTLNGTICIKDAPLESIPYDCRCYTDYNRPYGCHSEETCSWEADCDTECVEPVMSACDWGNCNNGEDPYYAGRYNSGCGCIGPALDRCEPGGWKTVCGPDIRVCRSEEVCYYHEICQTCYSYEYRCSGSWSVYSGSGANMKCYKNAKLG